MTVVAQSSVAPKNNSFAQLSAPLVSMGVDLFSKLRGSISLPQQGPGLGERPGRKRILGAFRAQNRVLWQQCDMSHNHSLIINIHYF